MATEASQSMNDSDWQTNFRLSKSMDRHLRLLKIGLETVIVEESKDYLNETDRLRKKILKTVLLDPPL